MKITNEFTVHTPIDRAWEVLTDLEGIAPCLPGAQLTGVEGEVYKGKVKVKVGPVISDFSGTAQFTEKDDTAYRAVIDAKGRDARAGGNASALVTAALKPDGDSTVVIVDTDLKISGKLAQFGSGMIKEISNKLLTQFVANLEAKLATEPAAQSGDPAPQVVIPTPSSEAPSAESLTANLVPAEPGAAEPAVPAVGGSEPLAASTTDDKADAVAAPPATSTPPAPTTTPAAVASATNSAPTSTAAATDSSPSPAFPVNGSAAPSPAQAKSFAASTEEPEPLDLLAVAGGSIYKRAIPVAIGAVVVVGVIVWFVARG